LDDSENLFWRDIRNPAGRIQCLFIAPKGSIPLLRQAPDTLLLDCTYKTNRFKMPLLNICGISPLRKAFSIAAVFLDGEKEKQYT